jgi:hypothetical protein
MLIIDETIETSSGDRTELIAHKPVVSFEEEKALYVRPLPREKNLPNLREIAGNKAYEYITGKRYYSMEVEEEKEPFMSRHFNKAFLFVFALVGIGVLTAIYFLKG